MKKVNYIVLSIFVGMQIGIDAAQPSYLQRVGQYAGQAYKASREQLARAYQWMKAHPGAALGTALAVVAGATAVGAGMRSSKSVPMQGQTMPNEIPIGGAEDQTIQTIQNSNEEFIQYFKEEYPDQMKDFNIEALDKNKKLDLMMAIELAKEEPKFYEIINYYTSQDGKPDEYIGAGIVDAFYE